MKVVLRYCESNSGVILKPQWPLIFDLIDDPAEETDLIDKAPGLCLGDAARCHGPGGVGTECRPVPPHQARARTSPDTRRLMRGAVHGSTRDLYG